MNDFTPILCYVDDNPHGRLAAGMPGAVPMANDELPAEKPAFILVQPSSKARWDLVWKAAKAKIPFALLDVMDVDGLEPLSAAAKRNKIPAVLLNSWRYIPAVAALKEIASSFCLGRGLRLKAPVQSTPEAQLRLQDLAFWLTGKEALPSELNLFFLHGENGYAMIDFSLDGQQSSLHLEINDHIHDRFIPKADPLVSELAILRFSIGKLPKIKKLPMMMTI